MKRLHFETGMVLATLSAAWCFFSAPETCLLEAARYQIVDQVTHYQSHLVLWALLGVLFQTTGIALVKCRRCLGASDYLRIAGLATIGSLWLLIGLSFMVDGRYSVSAGLLVCAGAGSYGAMFLIASAPKWRWR